MNEERYTQIIYTAYHALLPQGRRDCVEENQEAIFVRITYE
jgi:hypothetical protein